MQSGPAGFREIEHTADWELEVWALDLPSLLEQAARGMFHLAGVRLQDSPPQPVMFCLTAADAESLLVSFLGELLFYVEQNRLGFSGFDLQVSSPAGQAGLECIAVLLAQPLGSLEKEIKAVTYHRLKVETTPAGISTRIVFDV